MTDDALTPETRRDLLDGWRLATALVQRPDVRAAAASSSWPAALAAELYGAWYAGYEPPSLASDGAGTSTPALVHQLRAAHASSDRRTGGWIVRAVGARGAARVERGGEVLHLFPPDYVNLARPGLPVRVSDVVAATTRRDQLEVGTGWWYTYGRGDVTSGAPMVRIYWNCPADVAPDLVAAITTVVDDCAIPYSMKCPSTAEGYARVDPFVVYLLREDWGAIRAALRDVHSTIATRLRMPHPRLALPLGRGVALAEDPSDGQSFGQSRAVALADGALAAMAAGVRDDDAVLAVLTRHLSMHGVLPARPHLRRGTPPELVPPW
jgi:hypothetical protein